MIHGLYQTAAGMVPRMTQMDNVSNNLANVSTNGYKKSSVFLRQLITAQYALDHAMGRERTEVPEDVRVNYTQGTFERTENPFDFALNGSGFFRVRDNAGTVYYTRDGRFNLDPNGMLVNSQGMQVMDIRNNPIFILGDEVEVQGTGTIVVDGEEQSVLALAEFDEADYPALGNIGSGLFMKPQAVAEIAPNNATQFYQGYLEDANVDPVSTMVDMIELFRSFELGQKAIQIQDQTLQRVVTDVGSLRS